MNHCVPDFEMEDDTFAPATSGFSRPKRPATGEEEIMELLWQNGQVVVQSQNQRPPKKTTFGGGDAAEKEIRPTADEQQHLFMQEDEMASWLQYPLDDPSFDRDLYADLLYPAPPPPPPPPAPAPPAPTSTITQTRAVAEIRPPPAPPRPPIPPVVTKPDNSPRLQNFVHFSRLPNRPRSTEPMNKPSVTTARESTVVESNETPAVDPRSRISHTAAESRPIMHAETGAGGGYLAAAGARDVTETSSPGGSGASFIASGEMRRPPAPVPAAAEDRKRKARETDDNECQSEEDTEFEITEAKKQARGSTSTKRSRAAEVHNLSERRRRDRINEKMRALQELIPRCNKSDKASMLDEAIEYLKSLQLQVQMMSMGCGMVPMMYPGMQHYMPAMGLGMSMADMGMNRPMVPYPAMLASSTIPPQGAASHLGPRFPIPALHMPPVPGPDHSRVQARNQADPSANPLVSHNPSQPRMPNFVDQYQQFLGFHPAQLSLPQNLAMVQPPGANKPGSSKDTANPNNQRGG